MSNRLVHLVELSALVVDGDRNEPTSARQYAVKVEDDEPTVYGDQSWVRYGADGEGSIVERDITITYGPWRPVPPEPEAVVEAALNHALVAYDFNPNDPGMAPLGFARAAVEHALKALGAES